MRNDDRSYKTAWDLIFFFFQAEDGIRDDLVTGVQTCALPIWGAAATKNGHDKKRGRCRNEKWSVKKGGAAATRTGQYKKWGAAATRNGHDKKRWRCRNENWAIKKAGRCRNEKWAV